MNRKIEDVIEKVRVFTLAAVKKSRYEHSVRVAQTASALAKKYGAADPDLSYLAGIGHDMCKDMDAEVLFSLASHDGEAILDIERIKPSLLHGRAAAVKLQRDFGVDDKDVIEAVAVHTFGKAGMGELAKVLYIADKIEPGRSFVDKKYMASIAHLDWDGLLLKIVKDNIKYLQMKSKTSTKYAIAPQTLLLLDSLEHGALAGQGTQTGQEAGGAEEASPLGGTECA